MIVVLKHEATAKQIENLTSFLESQNVGVHVCNGEFQTVLGLIGDTSKIDIELLESLDMVSRVTRVSEPFKQANRKFHPDDTVISIGNVKIGGGHFAMIAGPCSVETPEQIMDQALCCSEVVHSSPAPHRMIFKDFALRE